MQQNSVTNMAIRPRVEIPPGVENLPQVRQLVKTLQQMHNYIQQLEGELRELSENPKVILIRDFHDGNVTEH